MKRILVVRMIWIYRGAFAANANTNAKPATNATAIVDTSPSVIAEQYAMRFERYKDYGIIYDKAADNLYFDAKPARYFEDYYPVGDNAYAGVDYFNENGTVDVHAVRDLSQIIHNADGSYDPSGKLIGVEQCSKAEFDARDIDKLKNPLQAYTAVHSDNDMSYSQMAACFRFHLPTVEILRYVQFMTKTEN